ncbi:MAG: hypothetical protein GF388_05895 [Candidatus Aegiribacteria sp.]|nr:hypothetical protein [Candidatus Aegiribacteria sp.]MBD3294713.1 hypothetical protein [Candidatus Fermentibacteria bacterium]
MPALPEYRTRILLDRMNVPLVNGIFVEEPGDVPDELPGMPLYLKAQIPGATSRKKHGLVRRIDSQDQLGRNIESLLQPGEWGTAQGVLITEGLELKNEYYAGCMLDFGSRDQLPAGILLFSPMGGSGVEERSGTVVRMRFSLIDPPSNRMITDELNSLEDFDPPSSLPDFLRGMVATFIEYKLTVLEVNPVGLLADGSVKAVDCRAEFEKSAVSKKDKELFFPPSIKSSRNLTRLEETVELINRDDPSGTGFFRQNRETPPEGSLKVATNLCGGGGKMLWEMTTGASTDIFTMNESDTSGGLSAFKSYRILRVILAQEDPQVLLLTGSGMAFQNQHHLAAAVWKALKESPTPLPSLLRFGGTDEDKARDLFNRVADELPVPVRTYPPEVFPNAMVEDIQEIAIGSTGEVDEYTPPAGEPDIVVARPPGKIYFFPDKWENGQEPPSVTACPTGFLRWKDGKVSEDPEVRCIGCLMCETAALLEGKGELHVELEMPMEVDR